MRRLAGKLAGTLSALVLAIVVSVAFGVAFFGDHRDFLAPVSRLFKFLLHPGGFCFYVVGTFSGSPALAYTAFVLGTLAVYLGIGLAIDALACLMRRRRRFPR